MTIRSILFAALGAFHLAGACAPPAPDGAAVLAQLAAQRQRQGLDADHHLDRKSVV